MYAFRGTRWVWREVDIEGRVPIKMCTHDITGEKSQPGILPQGNLGSMSSGGRGSQGWWDRN